MLKLSVGIMYWDLAAGLAVVVEADQLDADERVVHDPRLVVALVDVRLDRCGDRIQ
jgi:hypothetical protein